jgi:small-conductance mechanosensitive channel
MHHLTVLPAVVLAILGQIFKSGQGQTHKIIVGTAVLLGALFVAYCVYFVVFRFVLRRRISLMNHRFIRRFSRPAFWIFGIAAAMSAVPFFEFSESIAGTIEHILHICFLICIGWVLVAFVYTFEDIMVRRYDMSASDNLNARRIRTQLAVIRRVALIFVFVLTAGLVLYTFNHTRIWQYGAGLIASAGLASFALASAAKTTVGNMLAGIQIALTEPIRLDDVVIVDGQWGRIEEITSAYVVVKIWNLERLIVPLTWFIENPFQNWTRTSSDLLGTFYIYVDYTCPVDPLREEFERILKETDLWDGKAQVLQVTDLFKTTMQLRCLLSASDSGKLFNLRCLAREKMILFIQQNYPQHLPTLRFAENAREQEHSHEHSLPGSLPGSAHEARTNSPTP